MNTACLPDTGSSIADFALIAGLALVLIVGGVVALRKPRGAAALILLPLAFLALAFGGGATQAQALNAAIPSATVSVVWSDSLGTIASEVPSAENAANIGTLFNLASATESAKLTVNGLEVPGPPFWLIDPVTYQLTMPHSGVEDFVEDNELEFGTYPLVFTITYDYADDCGKPLQTVFTYEGVFDYDQPPAP